MTSQSPQLTRFCCRMASSTSRTRSTPQPRYLYAAAQCINSTPASYPTSTCPSTPIERHQPSRVQARHLHTSPQHHAIRRRPKPADNPDRGPVSKEDTQTDFTKLNVLGATAQPSTSIDVCTSDGFLLDSGLRIGDGDGVLIFGGEAFVWRPWMAADIHAAGKIVNGNALKGLGGGVGKGTGGVVNAKGQFELSGTAWGVLETVWPKPDLLIVGTGASIRPLAPSTRKHLETLGIRIEVLDTRNAASQFNLLVTERGIAEVAVAMVPVGF